MSLLLYGFFVWFIILILAVVNGSIRDFFYKKNRYAQQISSIILSVAILIVTYIFLAFGKFNEDSIMYAYLGFMWLIMTVLFEFLFFHYVMKHSFDELLENYNILKGKLWIIVLLTTLLAPAFVNMFLLP